MRGFVVVFIFATHPAGRFPDGDHCSSLPSGGGDGARSGVSITEGTTPEVPLDMSFKRSIAVSDS